jgi:hypothetical protein
MPDHEPTRGDEPSLTPSAGTEPNLDEQGPASRRFPRLNLAALSAALPKFGRKKGATAESSGESAAPADEGYAVGPEPETSPRRFPRIAWHKLPLANARRETRVGVAALASFLILVSALVLNRVTRKDEKPDERAASGTLLALNTSDDGGKEKGSEPAGKAEQVQPPKDATEKVSAVEPPKEPTEKPSTRRPDPGKTGPPEDATPPRPSLPTPPADGLPAMSGPSPTSEVAIAPPAKPRADATPAKPPEEPIARPQPATASTKAADPPPNPLAAAAPPALPTPTPGPAPVSEDLPSMPSTAPVVAGPAIEPPSIAPATPDSQAAPKPAEPSVEALPAPAGAPFNPFPANEPLPAPAPEPTTRPSLPETRPRNDPAPHPLPEPTPVEPRASDAAQPTRPEPVTPTPALAPEPTPAAKLPAFTKPPIESEPAPSPADASTALPSGGRLVRSLGKRRMPDPEPQARLAPERTVPDAPLPREEVGARDQEDPILHVVDSNENFWTISRTYYGSGRYYKALHAANLRLVPKIDELYVGTTVKVPPVEALDPTMIDPPSRSTDGAATRASRSATAASPRPTSTDDGRSVPSRTRGEVARGLSSSRARDVDEPTRPIYRVRAHDTLRSIARDTLGDPHRYREILDLNRDALDDGGRLVPGVTLTLPEDAAVRDR